jgi:hypothetical protein
MQRQFRHLNFKTIPMVSWRPNLVFFTFSTKALNIWDFNTSAIPKVGVQLGIIGHHFLHSPPFVRVFFTLEHIYWPHGPLHSTFNREPNVRIVTLNNAPWIYVM